MRNDDDDSDDVGSGGVGIDIGNLDKGGNDDALLSNPDCVNKLITIDSTSLSRP